MAPDLDQLPSHAVRETFGAARLVLRTEAEGIGEEPARIAAARSFSARAIAAYVAQITANTGQAIALSQPPQDSGSSVVAGLADRLGAVAADLDVEEAAYLRTRHLYGVFTDPALRWTAPRGVIASVTSTSFLAGEYFKARRGAFEDVLQETLLATYRRGGGARPAAVHHVAATPDGIAGMTRSGNFSLPAEPADPWLLPREPEHTPLIARLAQMPTRLSDWGYAVSTGPLVWNRHKSQLRSTPCSGAYPLIWAEAVTPDGRFLHRALKRNHQPYFRIEKGDDWLKTSHPCVLVQRITAREQRRRLIAAELPASFVAAHGAVVIENHLNMVRPSNGPPKVSPAAVAALLNSEVVDRAFRCISGSVAVSAYELEALPLPGLEDMKEIEALVACGRPREAIEQRLRAIYFGEDHAGFGVRENGFGHRGEGTSAAVSHALATEGSLGMMGTNEQASPTKTTELDNPQILTLRDSIIFEGDALTVLQRLPDASVQCVVTSPPYWGLRDYNHTSPDQIGLESTLPQFINRLTEVFREARRVLKDDGILWLNIGDGYTSGNRGWRAPDKKNRARAMTVRPDTPDGLKPKDLLGVPWRLAFSLQEDGWYLRADIIWNKPNAMPESVKDRPTRSHEYLFMFTKSERYKYDRAAILDTNGRNRRSVWDVNTQGFSGAHFATFPPRLIEPCILASTEPGDVVLDPFFGAGTVGVVAQQHKRRYMGIELHPDYVALAARRLEAGEYSIIRIAA